MRCREECGGDVTSWGGGRRDQSEWRLRVTEMDQHRGAGSHGHCVTRDHSSGHTCDTWHQSCAVVTRVTRGISLVPGGKILQDFGSAGHWQNIAGVTPQSRRVQIPLFIIIWGPSEATQTFSRPQEMNNICPGSEAGDVNHRKPWIYWPCRMLREWADIITPWFLSTCQSGLRSVKLRDLKYSEPQNSCRGIFLFIRAALNGIGIVI